MADDFLLSLLKQGVEAWNKWRTEHQSDLPDLFEAILSESNLSGANLSGVYLSGADLRGADLSGANLSGAHLFKSNLSGTNLSGRAQLIEANLIGADLSGANLRLANLTAAHLYKANLSGALLSGALLSGADLRGADLSFANLSTSAVDETILEEAIFGFTIFANLDLSACRGLDSVSHRAPSTLGIDSVILSKGRIPEIFLRGVGLPDEWITYIPSLVGDAIQFFSCFISYSSLDKAFAVRLHDALQSKGIRCWLDEKQLLPGHDISRELVPNCINQRKNVSYLADGLRVWSTRTGLHPGSSYR